MQVEDRYRYFEGRDIVNDELSAWLAQSWNFALEKYEIRKLSFFLLLCGFVSACATTHIAFDITAVTASFALAFFNCRFDCLSRQLNHRL